MADGLLWTSFTASLGTSFVYDGSRDSVLIVSEEGTTLEVPAPDLREYLDLMRETAATIDYSPAFERATLELSEAESRLETEKLEAPVLLSELLALPSAARDSIVHHRARYHNYFLVILALERSRGAVHHDPAASRDLADLARIVAKCLPVTSLGEDITFGIRAYSEAVYGNAVRLLGDLRKASLAFENAHQYLEKVSGPSQESVEVLNLEVSLRRDLHDYARAIEISGRAIQGFLERGALASAAKAMLTRATVFELMDDQDSNIATLMKAAQTINIEEDPWITLLTRHSLVVGLARQGRVDEAEKVRRETLGLYEQFPVPGMVARRAWAEGLLHEGRGDLDAAAAALDRARETFTNHGYPMDAAVVSLDLAAILQALGRYREVQAVTAASYTLLESQGVHPDALAALAQFQQAAAKETLTRELVRQVARRLVQSPLQRSKPS